MFNYIIYVACHVSTTNMVRWELSVALNSKVQFQAAECRGATVQT